MLVKAEQKYLRISPRKIRLIAEAIKDLPPQEALIKLNFIRKRGAAMLAKVIKQAIANAVKVKRAKEEDLHFKHILVGQGQILKRWRAAPRGRAARINKRSCHIKVVLESKEGGKVG